MYVHASQVYNTPHQEWRPFLFRPTTYALGTDRTNQEITLKMNRMVLSSLLLNEQLRRNLRSGTTGYGKYVPGRVHGEIGLIIQPLIALALCHSCKEDRHPKFNRAMNVRCSGSGVKKECRLQSTCQDMRERSWAVKECKPKQATQLKA